MSIVSRHVRSGKASRLRIKNDRRWCRQGGLPKLDSGWLHVSLKNRHATSQRLQRLSSKSPGHVLPYLIFQRTSLQPGVVLETMVTLSVEVENTCNFKCLSLLVGLGSVEKGKSCELLSCLLASRSFELSVLVKF